MKASSEEIYSKFWLIVTVAALLTWFANCEIFSGVEVENRHFHPRYCDCRPPIGEERPAIYQRNLCIADNTGLSSFILPLLPLKSAKSREIPRKFKRRASTLLIIESAYATSYYSLIVRVDVSRTVSEILTHKARKSPFSLTVLRS